MALDPVPWMIGGDAAVHSAEVGRSVVFGYAKDANGVILPADMLVKQTSTPGSNVRVYPGGAVLFNAYSGGAGQSYIIRNATETLVAIPATGGGGGATRYVIAYVEDPQYGGDTPVDPAAGPYCFIDIVSTLSGINYPYVPLAKITQPVSTATITDAMITDLRECAQPRQQEIVIPRPSLTGDPGMTLGSHAAYPQGEWFPNSGGDINNGVYQITIPKWATRMQIRFEWNSVRCEHDAGWGSVWVAYGPDAGITTPPTNTQAFSWDANEEATYRTNFIVHQEVAIPAAWRGTNQPFIAKGCLNSPAGAPYTGVVQLTATSGTVFSVRFLEIADQEI